MPLYLRDPVPGKTPYYAIRGTHLDVTVEKSTGTKVKKLALQILKQKERDIESGYFVRPGETTFGQAADRYVIAGGDAKYLFDAGAPEAEQLKPLLDRLADVPLSKIDQAAIDDAAGALYPDAGSPTRNRQVYTPISAVLKHAGVERKVKRPKGWQGRRRTFWLRPDQAAAVFEACDKLETRTSHLRIEFRIFLRLLCYTGMRLSDALKLQCLNVDLKERTALLPRTKNELPRMVHLPPIVVEELKHLPKPIAGRVGRVFRFSAGSRMRDRLAEVLKMAGVVVPEDQRVKFHMFCHTWGTWMRMYGGLSKEDLLTTKRWIDPKSAEIYDHMIVSDPARKADLLPGAQEAA